LVDTNQWQMFGGQTGGDERRSLKITLLYALLERVSKIKLPN